MGRETRSAREQQSVNTIVKAIDKSARSSAANNKSSLGRVGNKGNLKSGVQRGNAQKAFTNIKKIGKDYQDKSKVLKKRVMQTGSILDASGDL